MFLRKKNIKNLDLACFYSFLRNYCLLIAQAKRYNYLSAVELSVGCVIVFKLFRVAQNSETFKVSPEIETKGNHKGVCVLAYEVIWERLWCMLWGGGGEGPKHWGVGQGRFPLRKISIISDRIGTKLTPCMGFWYQFSVPV